MGGTDYTWEMGHVFFRAASASTPWSWPQLEDTGTFGYGPYVIDEFSTFLTAYLIGDPTPYHIASVWYTTSVWHGDILPGAYGVYTTGTGYTLSVE